MTAAADGDVAIRDSPEASRFEIIVDGEVAGFADYRDGRSGRALTHTVIEPAYEGRGLASTLIRFVLDEARSAQRRILPFCSFARDYIAGHRDYLDLVDDPARFDLPAAAAS